MSALWFVAGLLAGWLLCPAVESALQGVKFERRSVIRCSMGFAIGFMASRISYFAWLGLMLGVTLWAVDELRGGSFRKRIRRLRSLKWGINWLRPVRERVAA